MRNEKFNSYSLKVSFGVPIHVLLRRLIWNRNVIFSKKLQNIALTHRIIYILGKLWCPKVSIWE